MAWEEPGTKAAQTRVVAPGVHADFDRHDILIGVEVLEAKDVLGGHVQFGGGSFATPGTGIQISRSRRSKMPMIAISLKLPADLLESSDRCAEALRLSRAEYFRQALERVNRETTVQLRARHLQDTSLRVRRESMRINAEFAATETGLHLDNGCADS